MSIIDTLITDRTQAGHYDITDLNRVGEAMYYIADRLRSCGLDIEVSPRTDWVWTDRATPAAAKRYLNNLRKIRKALVLFTTTPEVPTGARPFNAQEANDIERILADVDWLIDQMKANVNAGWAIGTSHTGLYAANPTVKLLSESGAILVDDLENAPDLLTLPDGNGSTVLVESDSANYLYEVI